MLTDEERGSWTRGEASHPEQLALQDDDVDNVVNDRHTHRVRSSWRIGLWHRLAVLPVDHHACFLPSQFRALSLTCDRSEPT